MVMTSSIEMSRRIESGLLSADTPLVFRLCNGCSAEDGAHTGPLPNRGRTAASPTLRKAKMPHRGTHGTRPQLPTGWRRLVARAPVLLFRAGLGPVLRQAVASPAPHRPRHRARPPRGPRSRGARARAAGMDRRLRLRPTVRTGTATCAQTRRPSSRSAAATTPSPPTSSPPTTAPRSWRATPGGTPEPPAASARSWACPPTAPRRRSARRAGPSPSSASKLPTDTARRAADVGDALAGDTQGAVSGGAFLLRGDDDLPEPGGRVPYLVHTTQPDPLRLKRGQSLPMKRHMDWRSHFALCNDCVGEPSRRPVAAPTPRSEAETLDAARNGVLAVGRPPDPARREMGRHRDCARAHRSREHSSSTTAKK